jgi:hypothetical protein
MGFSSSHSLDGNRVSEMAIHFLSKMTRWNICQAIAWKEQALGYQPKILFRVGMFVVQRVSAFNHLDGQMFVSRNILNN